MSSNRSTVDGNPYERDLRDDANNWEVPLTITAAANQNFFSAIDMLYNTLTSLSLTKGERKKYEKMNKKIYPFIWLVQSKKYKTIHLRTAQSIDKVMTLLKSFELILMRGKISTGNETFTIGSLPFVDLGYNKFWGTSYNTYHNKIRDIFIRYWHPENGYYQYEYSRRLSHIFGLKLKREIDRNGGEGGYRSNRINIVSVIDIKKNKYDLFYFSTIHMGLGVKSERYGYSNYVYYKGLTTDELSQIKKYTISPMDEINPKNFKEMMKKE
jgi:hypothetical protein